MILKEIQNNKDLSIKQKLKAYENTTTQTIMQD